MFKPINNSTRLKKRVISYYTNNYKFKRLSVGKKLNSGRNAKGCILLNRRGGGFKKSFVLIDFLRRWTNKLALCINLSKDSYRTCFLALIKYSTGTYSYILAPHELKPGTFIFSTIRPPRFSLKYKVGCNVILRYLDYRSVFFNLEINPGDGGKYAKSAGTFCKLISINFDKELVKVQLPTGFIKIVSIYCLVTLGKASNIHHKKEFFTKAGFYRNLGIRPSVRGVAMNPVDHPHGGRTKTNSPELTP
jgi:large subunit ribosomal protein L2